IKKLRAAGFSTYLVGGSVRDLLAKQTPKDFDISTSARPEQIKQIFQKNCLLIGRRFRLAHIRFGHKILEVATFRAGENDSDLIVQDNIWGSEEEDVRRRDFTINGLLYDPESHTVIDYVGGWEDIHKGILRVIGDPATRFKQDPVRMLRLLKFRARFKFNIDPEARSALINCREEIIKSSPARLLEELLRMLESGASAPFFSLMNEAGLLELLMPPLAEFLRKEEGKQIYMLLASADKINLKNLKNPLDRSVLTACLLYPLLVNELTSQYLDKGETPHLGEITILSASVVKAIVTSSFTHFPRRISAISSFILATQYRLNPISGKRNLRPRMLHHKEFDLALSFLRVRANIDPSLREAYNAWQGVFKHRDRHSDHKGH
nr:polynucleotide adenylyltransferase PcnB [Parachlamydiaceae bacterium]